MNAKKSTAPAEKNTRQVALIVLIGLILVGAIVADILYISTFSDKFEKIEKEYIVTSNKLTTAKIVHENLKYVKELVFKNMDFAGHPDSIRHESRFFEFFTTCINDLKLKLISVQPKRPETDDRITIYSYEVELEGDFFKFGELCAKLENSRRLVSVENFEVSLVTEKEKYAGGAQHKKIHVKMRLNTYRISEG
jgi:Tfp pilus assembly protein PilO